MLPDFPTFEESLEHVLDEEFPKGECKERGHALVLYAMAIIYFKKFSEGGE